MTLRDETEKYLFYCQYQKQLDEKTVAAYKNDLSQFMKFLDHYDNLLTKENLNKYLIYLHENFKQKSVKRKIASAKAFFNYLESEEIIEINPLQSIKSKFKEDLILPKAVSQERIEMLLNYLYELEMDRNKTTGFNTLIVRDIAIIELLFATGLRISELCSLKAEDFDMAKGVLCIKGKGGKERYLQICNEDVISILNRYFTIFEHEIMLHGYFFVNRYGEQLSEQSARRMIHKHVESASINSKITPHMFRHAFATLLLEEDVDIRYIQKMLGHSSIVTTQIYTFVTSKKQQEILRTKHPRNNIVVQRKRF